jgi:hypothetical protein
MSKCSKSVNRFPDFLLKVSVPLQCAISPDMQVTKNTHKQLRTIVLLTILIQYGYTLKKEQSLFILAGRIVNLILGVSLQHVTM